MEWPSGTGYVFFFSHQGKEVEGSAVRISPAALQAGAGCPLGGFFSTEFSFSGVDVDGEVAWARRLRVRNAQQGRGR